MNIELETKNLLLRPLKISDAEAFFEMDKNPNVQTFLWNTPVLKIEESIETINFVHQQYKENKIGRFAIVLKSTSEFVGWAGLKFNTEQVNNKINFYDIGYRLNERFWGNGFASEASFAWRDYSFDQMKIELLTAGARHDNKASNRILQKIGMTQTEQYLENDVLWNWYEMVNSSF